MFVLVLASLLANPSAGQPWTAILRPAVVVQEGETSTPAEVPVIEEGAVVAPTVMPRLIPAKTVKPGSKTVKRPSKRASVSKDQ